MTDNEVEILQEMSGFIKRIADSSLEEAKKQGLLLTMSTASGAWVISNYKEEQRLQMMGKLLDMLESQIDNAVKAKKGLQSKRSQ